MGESDGEVTTVIALFLSETIIVPNMKRVRELLEPIEHHRG